jgi:ParB/RepB/Spo0J family partition protein
MTEASATAVAPTESPATRKSDVGPGVTKRTSAFFIDPDTIAIDPAWNIRWDMGDVEGLAEMIHAELKRDPSGGGLLEQLGVRRIPADHPLAEGGKKHFAVVWGHRRTLALRLLRKKGVEFPVGVPAKIVDKKQDIRHSTIQMFVENSQKPLLPMEEAAAYKRLKDGFPDEGVEGMTIQEICEAVGRAHPHVTEMLALLEADPEVQEAAQKGEVSKMDAKHIAKIAKGDKATQKKLVAQAKAAKKGDKKARSALQKGLHDVRAAKAAKKGRTIKLRALSDQELNDLGLSMAKHLKKLLKNNNKPEDIPMDDLRKWVEKEDKLALAATFGAIMALRAAAGVKTHLDF